MTDERRVPLQELFNPEGYELPVEELTWAMAVSSDDDAVLGRKLQEAAENSSGGLEVNWSVFAGELRKNLILRARAGAE